jgi:hypothetical protein
MAIQAQQVFLSALVYPSTRKCRTQQNTHINKISSHNATLNYVLRSLRRPLSWFNFFEHRSSQTYLFLDRQLYKLLYLR